MIILFIKEKYTLEGIKNIAISVDIYDILNIDTRLTTLSMIRKFANKNNSSICTL